MNKKLEESIFDDTPGAVFIAQDTNESESHVWPACLGIRKYEGCVEYGTGSLIKVLAVGLFDNNSIGKLGDIKSDAIYNDHCGDEEAWLVTPHGKHYLWVRVDHKLKLLC